MKTLINVQHLHMSYGNKKVLTDINFEINQGDFLTIIGENGSGKSTLVKGLLGLKPLDEGTVNYLGVDLNQIGYLPQNTQIQHDFPASVKEIVLSGCVNRLKKRFFYNAQDKQRMRRQLQRLQIEDLANQHYIDLSIGQRQRVLLARALCATDQLIILDEPVTSLDPHITRSFYELLKELNQQGLTVVMITHDISQVVDAATKVLLLNGQVQYFGNAQDYLVDIPQGGHDHA